MHLLLTLLLTASMYSEAAFRCGAAEAPVKEKYVRMDLQHDREGTFLKADIGSTRQPMRLWLSLLED